MSEAENNVVTKATAEIVAAAVTNNRAAYNNESLANLTRQVGKALWDVMDRKVQDGPAD